MPEPMTADINVSITPTDGTSFTLEQHYLGMKPFVLFLWNDETEQFDIEAGGGISDLDGLKLVVGFMAEALGFDVTDPDPDQEPTSS